MYYVVTHYDEPKIFSDADELCDYLEAHIEDVDSVAQIAYEHVTACGRKGAYKAIVVYGDDTVYCLTFNHKSELADYFIKNATDIMSFQILR